MSAMKWFSNHVPMKRLGTVIVRVSSARFNRVEWRNQIRCFSAPIRSAIALSMASTSSVNVACMGSLSQLLCAAKRRFAETSMTCRCIDLLGES